MREASSGRHSWLEWKLPPLPERSCRGVLAEDSVQRLEIAAGDCERQLLLPLLDPDHRLLQEVDELSVITRHLSTPLLSTPHQGFDLI